MFRSYSLNFITFSSSPPPLTFKYTLCVSCSMRNIQTRKEQNQKKKIKINSVCLYRWCDRYGWSCSNNYVADGITLDSFSIRNQKKSVCNWTTNFHSTLIIIWSWTVHLNSSVIVVVIAERFVIFVFFIIHFQKWLVICEERQKHTAEENFGLIYN